ncbi:glycosyltransferase family 39 protein [Opitutus terrae]|uniref:Glycosyltransferase RgtA/B/C/D-like domain-containing protein n=1 Tax=Opitutus terrae (strain DSM 11246 / JCM 15787 / PB90-1) TaxID=452637 RepID=B1ZVW1_OPITP|nr:glycosyltransferase family 39 protein [Opitutus terrae]ACB75047.1 hypothetical protein Oter_1763 [Opitutus terrae PB90-1]
MLALWTQLRQHRARVVLLLLTSVLALRLGFGTFTAPAALTLVQHLGYPLTLFTFVAFIWSVWQLVAWREFWLALRAGGWKVALLIGVVSLVLHLQERHGFKVVNDELVQVSTSQRMHFEREANGVARGYELGTQFILMQGDVDKRPLFYPFLLSIVHDVSGYKVENAFLLNALLTPVLFGLIYLVACRIHGRYAGVAAMLLFATIPLVTQAATGGGFEVLNLVMIVATLYLGLRYAENPTELSLAAFCLSGVLLAQVRYESVLFVPCVIVVVVAITWINRRLLLPWAVLVAPLLLVIYPLQFNAFKVHPYLWQLDDRPSEAGVYSLSYFYDNVGRALRFFFAWDHSEPNSFLVGMAGIIGVGFFLMWLYRRSRELPSSPGRLVFTLFIVTLGAQAMLMLCYFWGRYDEVLTVRLSLPTHLLFVLAFIFVFPELVRSARAWHWLTVTAAFYLAVWTIPTLTRRAYVHENLAAETCNWNREYLASRPDRDFLVIDPSMPLLWIAYQVPSISYDTLAERASQFLYHFQQRTFSECLVVQKMTVTDFDRGTLTPVPEFDLGPAVTLATVREKRFTPTYAIRLSRIVRVDHDGFVEWAAAARASRAKSGKPDAVDDLRKEQEARYTRQWLENLP